MQNLILLSNRHPDGDLYKLAIATWWINFLFRRIRFLQSLHQAQALLVSFDQNDFQNPFF